MGGLCTKEKQKASIQTLEEEVQYLLPNQEYFRDPALLRKMLGKVIQYLYCKLKEIYLGKLVGDLNQFDQGLDGGEGDGRSSLSFLQNYHKLLENLITKVRINQDQLRNQLLNTRKSRMRIEMQIHPLKDSTGFEKRSKPKKVIQVDPFEQDIKNDPKGSQRSNSISRRQSSAATELTEFKPGTYSFTKQLLEVRDKQQMDLRNDDFNELNRTPFSDFNSAVSDLQSKLIKSESERKQTEQRLAEMEKTLAVNSKLIESLKKDLSVLDQDNRQLRQKLQSNKEKHQSQIQTIKKEFKKETFYESSIILEAVHERKNNLLQICSRVFQESFQVQNSLAKREEVKQKMPVKSDKFSDSIYLTMIKLFGCSKILPSYQTPEIAFKMRKDLQKMFRQPIVHTDLVYSFDSKSCLHFIDYISGEDNLVLFIDMGNNFIVGGFAGKIVSNFNLNQSFLFSFGPERSPLKLTSETATVKKIDIDPSFLTFGNSQLKIKAKSLKLFTNLGGFQCKYFLNDKRPSLESFFGSHERDHSIVGYELHKIYFE